MMRNYGNYGNYDRKYDYERRTRDRDNSYGRRARDSRGRYMGDDAMEEMYGNYQEYREGKEQYNRGNYGAKDDTVKSLEYMMQSAVDFIEMLKQDANSQEELDIIKRYCRQISEM